MIENDNTLLIMHTLSKLDESISSWDDLPKPPHEVRDGLYERIFPPVKAETFLKDFPNVNAKAIVVSDKEGLIQWVSPAFCRMCGYTLMELRGQIPGKMLQGAKTSAESVEILRQGIRDHRPVEAQLVNYHKSGNHYEVKIEMSPLITPNGEWDGFIAIETEIVV